MFKNHAFTLAEVLITLGIIGVVTVLVIPSKIVNYQKQTTVRRLQKTYSALANSTNSAIADYGPITEWEVAGSGGRAAEQFADKYILPYLNIEKNCRTKDTQDCEFKYRTTKNGGYVTKNSSWTRFYLTDGSFITLTIANWSDATGPHIYADTLIDVNGQNGPNLLNRDIFQYRYWVAYGIGSEVAGKFIPPCINCDPDTVRNACYTTGAHCSALIMQDGWQIKDGYPW